jgi:hypothetical protein
VYTFGFVDHPAEDADLYTKADGLFDSNHEDGRITSGSDELTYQVITYDSEVTRENQREKGF